MSLQIRPCDTRTHVLTDHRGVALPGQIAVVWSHDEPGSRATLTVTFMVDGFDIVTSSEPLPLAPGALPEALSAWGDLSEANRSRFMEAVGVVPGPLYAFRKAVEALAS